MVVLFGLYLLIGVVISFSKVADPNSARKPAWMLTERNPLNYAIYFAFQALLWPLGLLFR